MNSAQLSFFSKRTNYSRETSLPAYHSNTSGKKLCKERVYQAIKDGAICLLMIAEKLDMPQSSCAGRVSELIKEGKCYYSTKEDYISYKNKLRKKICIHNPH